jgi:hypothetical protein
MGPPVKGHFSTTGKLKCVVVNVRTFKIQKISEIHYEIRGSLGDKIIFHTKKQFNTKPHNIKLYTVIIHLRIFAPDIN